MAYSRGGSSATFIPAAGLLAAALLAGTAVADTGAVTGEAVYDYCVSCHGTRGAGGAGGKYPRIAGLPQTYIAKQLRDFKARRRVNKPMIPIFKHHRFDAEVIDLVAAHVAGMSRPDLALWPYEPSSDALAAFPSRAALAEAGQRLYRVQCSGCHGADGGGGADLGAPPLIGQYPAYLRKQIGDFATGQREHPQADRCGGISPAEAEAVIDRLVELGRV
jgi:cytochrome c553